MIIILTVKDNDFGDLMDMQKEMSFKSHQPERVPGIISVRPDTSDTGETALFPELVTNIL